MIDKIKNTDYSNLQLSLQEGKRLFDKADYVSALKHFNKVMDIEPQNKEVAFELGKTYYALGEFPRAIDLLQKAQKLNPKNGHIYILLAKSYKFIGEYDLTLKMLAKLKESGCSNADINSELSSVYDEKSLSQLAQTYNLEGKYDVVRKLIPEAIKFMPKDNIFMRNKLLNELEIAEGKVHLSSKPRRLNVTLSNKCNLFCIMCLTRYIKWEIPRRIIEEIYSLFPYLEVVMWQGGEVFALDFFEEILSVGYKYPNLRQIIVTNGQLITESIAEKLVKNNVELTISVDGASKEVYEYIRRGANFETLIKNLKIISELKNQYKSNMTLNLNVAIMKSNYHQLEDFIEFAKKFGFEFICLMPIHIHLKTPEDIFTNRDMQALTFITDISPKIEKKARQYGVRLENRLPRLSEKHTNKDKVEQDNSRDNFKEKKDTRLLCHIPWQQLLIDYDGSVRPDCLCRIEKNAGSLLENISLGDIWNNERMVEYRERIVNHDYIDFCNPICFSGKICESHFKIP